MNNFHLSRDILAIIDDFLEICLAFLSPSIWGHDGSSSLRARGRLNFLARGGGRDAPTTPEGAPDRTDRTGGAREIENLFRAGLKQISTPQHT